MMNVESEFKIDKGIRAVNNGFLILGAVTNLNPNEIKGSVVANTTLIAASRGEGASKISVAQELVAIGYAPTTEGAVSAFETIERPVENVVNKVEIRLHTSDESAREEVEKRLI